MCFSVTLALFLTETVFFSKWFWSGFFKVTQGRTGYKIRFATNETLYVFFSNYSAISHGNRASQQITFIWLFIATIGQIDHAIRSATHEFLWSFDSNHSAISHRNRVFQQMILIWPFEVNIGQIDHAIRSATYEIRYTFHSIHSAITNRSNVSQQMPRFGLARSPKILLIMPSDSRTMS